MARMFRRLRQSTQLAHQILALQLDVADRVPEKLFRQLRTARDRRHASLCPKPHLDDPPVFHPQRQSQHIAARRILHLHRHRRVLQLAHESRILKMVEHLFGIHRGYCSYNRRSGVNVGIKYADYAKAVFRPKQLESVFLFVTSTCNSLCRTCFYWDELNKGQDLTFEQLERVSETAPQFHKLWISGGEPFLRKELAEIIALFYRNNGMRHVNLPTNGLLPEEARNAS